MQPPVYLDNQATTPVDPRVLDAMLPYFGARFGNAASRSHAFGWEAEQAVERARRQVAELAGCAPREIVFTSGATESDNLAIKGVLAAYRRRGNHIITMSTEHKAVLDPVRRLQRGGVSATFLPPGADGLLDLDRLRKAIVPETVLVSVMYANNEIGVIQPVREIGAICREAGVLFHCDAAQAFGKIPVSVEDAGIGLLSVSAHKMYGPKGIGALYVRRAHPRVQLEAQMDGGGHESGMRSGTLNVPAIVGFGASCALCQAEIEAEAARVTALRGRLLARLSNGIAGTQVNGSMEHRLPGNLNLTFPGVPADALLMSLPDVALSTGSACSSATAEPSYVLQALGVSGELARCSVRFGLGRFNTAEEVDYAADRVIEAIGRLRSGDPALAGNRAASGILQP
ncbi:MAG TPA: IscS subfamily cysteine desulfurase [Bryobacteraceae bacterium]|nr:IscS subfamily cysteine desulfurase [Bryobacteraceae bacterium]